MIQQNLAFEEDVIFISKADPMDGKDQSASFQESIGQFTCDIIPYQHSFFIVTEMYAEVCPFPSNITSNPVL